MNVRSARYNKYGSIDCEIFHPSIGWLPFTASADGSGMSKTVFDYFIGAGAGSVMPYQPVEIHESVPEIVTRAQFKLALLDLGLLDDVDALVAASNDRALQINWAERLEFERNHPLVIATAAALGKTDAEIDALFVLAASK